MSQILFENHWDRPIWIIGNPRSGTSLFRIMLHSHPDVCIPPESHFFLWLETNHGQWQKGEPLDDFLEALFDSTKFETWQFDKAELEAFLMENQPENYAQLIALIYIRFGIISGKKSRFWGDKNKLWVDNLSGIVGCFPNTRFVHVVRDGRDIACSFKSLNKKNMLSKYAPKLPDDIVLIADRWKKNIRGILDLQRSYNHAHFLTVRYEDLLVQSRYEMERTCDFLGIQFQECQLEYYKETDLEKIEPLEFFQWKEKLLSPLDVSNIGKYKTELTPDEIVQFNEICKDELRYFHYI